MSGGGIENKVGMNNGAVGFYLNIVPQQLSIPVLGRRGRQGEDSTGDVHHLNVDVVWRSRGNILQSLDVHGVGGLTLQHAVEWHQKEFVFSEFSQVRNHDTVCVLTLQHRHYVEFLAATTLVTIPEKIFGLQKYFRLKILEWD